MQKKITGDFKISEDNINFYRGKQFVASMYRTDHDDSSWDGKWIKLGINATNTCQFKVTFQHSENLTTRRISSTTYVFDVFASGGIIAMSATLLDTNMSQNIYDIFNKDNIFLYHRLSTDIYLCLDSWDNIQSVVVHDFIPTMQIDEGFKIDVAMSLSDTLEDDPNLIICDTKQIYRYLTSDGIITQPATFVDIASQIIYYDSRTGLVDLSMQVTTVQALAQNGEYICGHFPSFLAPKISTPVTIQIFIDDAGPIYGILFSEGASTTGESIIKIHCANRIPQNSRFYVHASYQTAE